MIQLDENKNFKQVRFSPRLDFVPLIDKEKLDLYYSARNKISELYNSEKYRLEFKLSPGDLLMMDNHSYYMVEQLMMLMKAIVFYKVVISIMTVQKEKWNI